LQISNTVENVRIIWNSGEYATEGKELEHMSSCVDMEKVVPLPTGDSGTKELIGFEEAFVHAGGLWMLNDTLWKSGNVLGSS
jgi:hypothetical protein